MRFASLKIQNFRAIETFEVDGLTDFVVIAGPNGCGKSCVLDAIRLLKSVYGGYQANEWMQWLAEFQISPNDRTNLRRLFRDPDTPIQMAAAINLAESEKAFLREHAEEVLEPLVWARVTGQPTDSYNFSAVAFATQFRQFGDRVRSQIDAEATQLRQSLAADAFDLALTIAPDGSLYPASNPTMEVVFQTYRPDSLGIIEYHSASRSYQREAIGGVNLDARQLEAQRMNQSLYNWQGKYQNVKTELATTYIRDLVAREAGVAAGGVDLNETLKELFQTFFPEKEYLGVQPETNGGLNFPVRTRSGQVHDINELSSGEKEVLYGYLRLRNATPNNSTILLDEPELHLNPGLLRGFPDFYHRHLGTSRGNQLWLVTHSDTLLRQAVGNRNYSVFHMTSAPTEPSPGTNQAVPVIADDDLERATIDLVGDLATYRPQGKVVLFEGGGDTDVDVLIVQRLFPTFAKQVNLVSGGSKKRVGDLYTVLADTAEQIGLANRFFAITDKDSAPRNSPAGTRQLSWDVYHIENYLLEPRFVRLATSALRLQEVFSSDQDVTKALRESAEQLVPSLVVEQLRKIVNHRIVSTLSFGADPNNADPAVALLPSIEGTYARLDAMRQEVVDRTWLAGEAERIERELRGSLADGNWFREFPGRSVLKRFADAHLAGTASYEGFRNVILDQMADENHEPAGMRTVVDAVLSAD